MACFPAEGDTENWHSGGDLYAPYRAEAFRSQANILDFRNTARLKTELLEDLDVTINPETRLVIDHLQYCVKTGAQPHVSIYQVLNERAWTAQGPCLYLVGSSDGGVRYVGISRNGLKHRWRLSPAFDAVSRTPLSKRQLFHSQCWRHIERELTENFGRTFEVRHLDAVYLVSHLLTMGGPLAGLAALQAHGESVVAGVERWLCNHQNSDLAVWNKAMTGKRLAS